MVLLAQYHHPRTLPKQGKKMRLSKQEIFILIGFALTIIFMPMRGHAAPALPDRYVDIRYIGTPVRNADGTIKRDARVLREFQKIHPCPSTGLSSGSCPGWAKDHVISLDCGGIDAVWNMQWLPLSIKSASDPHAKDRFERKIYAATPPFPGTSNCTNSIVK
jgi:hypothetical protein